MQTIHSVTAKTEDLEKQMILNRARAAALKNTFPTRETLMAKLSVLEKQTGKKANLGKSFTRNTILAEIKRLESAPKAFTKITPAQIAKVAPAAVSKPSPIASKPSQDKAAPSPPSRSTCTDGQPARKLTAAEYATPPLVMGLDEFKKLTPADKMRFVKDGGKLD